MTVTIHYMAQLKHAAGTASEEFTVPEPCSLADLLRRAAEQHGLALQRLLFDANGQLNPTNLFFLGDNQVANLDQVQVKHGDAVTVLSPIAGGQP